MKKKRINAWLSATTKFYGKSKGVIEAFCWEQVLISLGLAKSFFTLKEKSSTRKVVIDRLTPIALGERNSGRLEVVVGIFLMLFGNRDRKFKFVLGIATKLSKIIREEIRFL